MVWEGSGCGGLSFPLRAGGVVVFGEDDELGGDASGGGVWFGACCPGGGSIKVGGMSFDITGSVAAVFNTREPAHNNLAFATFNHMDFSILEPSAYLLIEPVSYLLFSILYSLQPKQDTVP